MRRSDEDDLPNSVHTLDMPIETRRNQHGIINVETPVQHNQLSLRRSNSGGGDQTNPANMLGDIFKLGFGLQLG